MTETETEVGELARRLVCRRPGVCQQCGATIEEFVGHTHCESCIARHEREQEEVERNLRLDDHVNRGWFSLGARRCQFRYSHTPTAHTATYKQAQLWNRDRNVYLQGDVGTGKTWLARCMVNAAFDAGMSVCEITALEFCEGLRGFESRGIRQWFAPRVLLVDGLEQAPWTTATLGWFGQLLDRRGSQHYPTIVTTLFDQDLLVQNLRQYTQKNETLPTSLLDRLKPVLALSLQGQSLRRSSNAWGSAA